METLNIPQVTIEIPDYTTNPTNCIKLSQIDNPFHTNCIYFYYITFKTSLTMIAAHDIYENDYAKFWFAEHILFIEYKPKITIDLKVAQRVVADRIQLQNGQSYPVLCDIRGIIDSEKAGRDYLAQSGSVLITAAALIIHAQVSLTISNFYLQINKPTVPTKLFTTRQEALTYLKTFYR